MRDIECHCLGIAIFSRDNVLVFHSKLITDLVFTKDCDLLGEHVTDISHSFDSEVFCRVASAIDYFNGPPRQLNAEPLTTT
ncbi:MAG: hypothetical protein A2Y80_09035 [Deltaproteobacteria bacterium RBG_13_58_19]|nr:MAG: hypothetical protein A2Y80_09035 [Deltaproteobacteria bacterium RBG_13_58_19]